MQKSTERCSELGLLAICVKYAYITQWYEVSSYICAVEYLRVAKTHFSGWSKHISANLRWLELKHCLITVFIKWSFLL